MSKERTTNAAAQAGFELVAAMQAARVVIWKALKHATLPTCYEDDVLWEAVDGKLSEKIDGESLATDDERALYYRALDKFKALLSAELNVSLKAAAWEAVERRLREEAAVSEAAGVEPDTAIVAAAAKFKTQLNAALKAAAAEYKAEEAAWEAAVEARDAAKTAWSATEKTAYEAWQAMAYEAWSEWLEWSEEEWLTLATEAWAYEAQSAVYAARSEEEMAQSNAAEAKHIWGWEWELQAEYKDVRAAYKDARAKFEAAIAKYDAAKETAGAAYKAYEASDCVMYVVSEALDEYNEATEALEEAEEAGRLPAWRRGFADKAEGVDRK